MAENRANTEYREALDRTDTTNGGEEIYRFNNSIVAILPANRNSTSTSFLNGGYQENLKNVFNHESGTRNVRISEFP